jgi:hypothetical protein
MKVESGIMVTRDYRESREGQRGKGQAMCTILVKSEE